jgi:ABC-type bacteriocin/lantibiotic exporter with double-glycine peptidase domain
MEATECGAAALGMVLGYFGRHVSLEELRLACGISRDGSKASNIVRAARQYGLVAKGYKKEPLSLRTLPLPMIVFWNFNHFVVVEGFGKDRVYLNDPASGPRTVNDAEFDQAFTGVVLAFERGSNFVAGGARPSLLTALQTRLAGSQVALVYVVLAGLALIIPGLVIPAFSQIFIDRYLVGGLHRWIGPLLAGMALTALLRAALTWLQQYYLLRLETKLALAGASRFFWHILRLPIEFFSQRYGGEIGSRVNLNDRVAELLSGQLATTLINLALVVFYAVLMLQYDVTLTLVGLGIAALNMIALQLASHRRVDANREQLQERAKLTGATMSGLQMIETLKAGGLFRSLGWLPGEGGQCGTTYGDGISGAGNRPAVFKRIEYHAHPGPGRPACDGWRSQHRAIGRLPKPDGKLRGPGESTGGIGRHVPGSARRDEQVG